MLSILMIRARPTPDAPAHLDWWLAWACRSRIPAFVTLSKTVRATRDRILAAVELGLSNSKLEGLNSKIRLIDHRGYGHHSAAALIAIIYLCAGGITIDLPVHRPLAARTPRPLTAGTPAGRSRVASVRAGPGLPVLPRHTRPGGSRSRAGSR